MSFFGGNAFGKPATTSAFGSFGNAQTQPAGPGSNLFSSFGAANQNQTTQQPGVPMTGNSLFPPANTGTNPLFGGAKPTGSLFGNTPTASQPPTGPAGGNMFGGSNMFGNSTSAPAAQGGANTFGAPAGSTLFGTSSNPQPATANPPTLGTGLFGQQQPQQPQQQQGPQLSMTIPALFGQQPQQQPYAASQFGQSSTQPQQQRTGLFGNIGLSTTNPTSNTIGGSSLFGNAQPGNSLHSFSNAGNSTSSFFTPRTTLVQSQQQADSAQVQFPALVQRIEAVAQAWDVDSPQCCFQHFFYNLVDPSQVQMYGRPQNATNDALWQKAVRENPDPSCYVPALAVGFEDLQKRAEAQRAQATAHQEKLKELRMRIASLNASHSSTNSPRLQRATAMQTQLHQRLVRLVQHLHLLIPSVRSSSIRPEEETLRSVLESLEEEIRRPSGVGRLKGKLSELWAIIGAIDAARERERKNGDNNVEWAVVDPEGLQRLTEVLGEQQNGISHLTKIVNGHRKDLDVILGKPPQEREADAFSTPQASQVLLGASGRGAQHR